VGQSINEKSELKYSSCLCKKGQFIMLRLNFLSDLRTEKEIFHLSNFTLEAVIVNQPAPLNNEYGSSAILRVVKFYCPIVSCAVFGVGDYIFLLFLYYYLA
jgi:hypothetical protein